MVVRLQTANPAKKYSIIVRIIIEHAQQKNHIKKN